MDIIEKSKFVEDDGSMSLLNRISTLLDFGSQWVSRIQAQNIASNRLAKVLGNEHILIRNPSIPGVDESQPFMILIGPQGIRVILVFHIRGVFRANGSNWLKFRQGPRRFVIERKNPQILAIQILEQVSKLLKIQNYQKILVEPVLMFTHSRAMIDSARPECRIVTFDAIDFFANNLVQSPPQMESEQVHALVDAILYPKYPEPEDKDEYLTRNEIDEMEVETASKKGHPKTQPIFEDFNDLEADLLNSTEAPFILETMEDDLQPEQVFRDVTTKTGKAKSRLSKGESRQQPRISKAQWRIIGALILIEIIILIIFTIIVFRDSGFI